MASSSGVGALSHSFIRTPYPPDSVALQLGLREFEKLKRTLSVWPSEESAQKVYLETIREVITPILKELHEFVKEGDSAVKFSRKSFEKLPFSVTVVSSEMVFVHNGINIGSGGYKIFKSLIPLFSGTECVIASPINKSIQEENFFKVLIKKKNSIYRKLSGIPGLITCHSLIVENAIAGGRPKALILEKFECSSMEFLTTYCPRLDPLERLAIKLKIMKIAIDAVAEMHSRNIAHLDLKNANFVINPKEQRAALIDFDFAVDFTDSMPASIFGGTFAFRPPEITKVNNGLKIFLFDQLSAIKKEIIKNGVSGRFGEQFTKDCDDRTIEYRIAKKICFSYDVWGLGMVLGIILLYNTSDKILWSTVCEYLDFELDTPIENAFLSVVKGMLTKDYENRPSIFEIQKQAEKIITNFESTPKTLIATPNLN